MDIKLGLGDVPGRAFIFIGGGSDTDPYLWYFYDDGQIPIREKGLTGRITKLKLTPKEFKNKWEYKLDVTVMADKEYVIRSGSTTSFSKGLVAKLSTIENLDTLFCIEPRPGNSDKVIFCNLHDLGEGKQVFFEGDMPDKISPLVFALQERLGCDIQSTDSVLAEQEAIKERGSSEYTGSNRPNRKEQDNDDIAF